MAKPKKESKNYPTEVLAALDKRHISQEMIDQVNENLARRDDIDCPVCEGNGTFVKDPHHVHINEELRLKLAIPARVCTSCGEIGYETEDYCTLLQAEELAQGKAYVRVEAKSGRIIKYSVH